VSPEQPGGAPPAAEDEDRAAIEDEERSVGELVLDISERVSLLVREEIELAKAEVTEKVSKIARGAAAGAAAVLFVVLAFAMIMHSGAWLLNDLFFENEVWLGFLVEAIIWLILAAIAGLLAYRWAQAGAPPIPEGAIEEAKETREILGGGDGE
jgi:hypothetical protein